MSTDTTYKYSVSVVFKENGQAYTFATSLQDFVVKEQVIVETSKGVELAFVEEECRPIKQGGHELKPVLRRATKKDQDRYVQNKEKALEALKLCQSEVERIQLDMNLMEADYTLDRSKITFVYVAEERVDFRELLKNLATKLHCRIELRQIGPRNKAKMVGGVGQCGQELCCSRFLNDFSMVSINMAKNQMLALNISKLSGQCGKLKCCLRYEDQQYKEARKGLPKLHSKVEYNGKTYHLSSYNVMMRQAKLEANGDIQFVDFDELWPEMDKQ